MATLEEGEEARERVVDDREICTVTGGELEEGEEALGGVPTRQRSGTEERVIDEGEAHAATVGEREEGEEARARRR